mgnify:CR=1 FL=1
MTKEKNMIIKNVTIAGAGVLGSQVAWQTALHGFNVFVFDICKDSIEKSKELHKQFAELFLTTRGASQLTVEAALNRINYTTDLAEAVNDADIISESVPESIEVKADFYRMLSQPLKKPFSPPIAQVYYLANLHNIPADLKSLLHYILPMVFGMPM